MRIRQGGYDDLRAILETGLRINSRVRPEHMVVAEDDEGNLAGFAYCFLSGLHRERYWVTTRVCDGYRREGLGTDLVRELGKVRDEDKPFYVKMREDNPALEWIRSFGGVDFQVCPPMSATISKRRGLMILCGTRIISTGSLRSCSGPNGCLSVSSRISKPGFTDGRAGNEPLR